jgi:hypothetical protein
MTTPSGKLGSLSTTSARLITTVSVSSGTRPAAQAVGQVGWAIVPVQLPLEGLAARCEDLHLPRDQRVEFVAVEAGEVAVLDEAAIAEAERPHKRPIALYADGIRKPVVHVPAQLRVVGGQ